MREEDIVVVRRGAGHERRPFAQKFGDPHAVERNAIIFRIFLDAVSKP
jgi:hypothetical protein